MGPKVGPGEGFSFVSGLPADFCKNWSLGSAH